MKKVVSCLVVMVGVFLCGCSSYRFQGHVAKGACALEPCAMKYRIGPFVLRVDRKGFFDGTIEGDMWAIPQAAQEFSEVRIRRDVVKLNPNLFTCSGKGIPLAVTIRVYGEPKDGAISGLPYFMTLGVCPLRIGETTPCEITVSIVGARDISQSCPLQFRSDAKLSAILPLGLVQFDAVPGASSCRRGNGFMTAPQLDFKCQAAWESVFVETLADGIVVCVQEIEKRTPPDVLTRLASVP